MQKKSMVSENAQRERNSIALHKATSNIGGLADALKRDLATLDREIKEDEQGVAEFVAFKTKLEVERATLAARVKENEAWIENFSKQQGDGSFEQAYKQLLVEINDIYEHAKEFHAKGIDMLIKEFGYHIAYKRWNDTFTAIPFKPK